MAVELKKKKYRVLIVIRWPVGGIRTFIRYVYNKFDPSRYSITLIAPEVPELKVLRDDLKGLDVECVPFKDGISGPGLMLLVLKTLAFGRFDLVHSNGFMAGVSSALPALITRTRHMMTSHDVFLSKQFRGAKGRLKKKALSLILPMIDLIHSVSHDAEENLIEFVPALGRRKGRLVVIPNGIDTERFSRPEKRDLRKELGLGPEVFLIGFLGRFMSQKGFVVLMDALERLEKKALPRRPVVVAFGFGGFIREDKEYLARKGLGGSVFFLPFTPDVSATLKGLDVVAMPSLWEACPLLPMEAMVAGVPLIGTDCIGLREVINGTPCAKVAAGDSEGLARAIENEMTRPSSKRTEDFREEAGRRFDVSRQARTLEETISRLIEGA